MRILMLGGGGREHALCWKIKQSPLCTDLIAAPGNAGIADLAHLAPELDIEDGEAVRRFCIAEKVDFVVIGPEAPLAAGVADILREEGIAVFGPSAQAAQLESSKTFTKEICDACGAPTASWARFDSLDAAKVFLMTSPVPVVVKADGLAAGKGVVVAQTTQEALEAVEHMFAGSLGQAGHSVVIEEFMPGEEASYFVLTDGVHVLPLASAQDHKRAFDGDEGPNTGGMGAYSPAPILSAEIEDQVLEQIIKPVIREMKARGIDYTGVLYAGLMIENGKARLVEFNARFGDPECQILMMRLQSDLVPALLACSIADEGYALKDMTLDWIDAPAITVVVASNGYPGSYEKGEIIHGVEEASAHGAVVFHAGTRTDGTVLLSNGGRVLNVCASGTDINAARQTAYSAVGQIDWPGGFYRRDIGWRALK
ncbi:MAG: phosphoribosylamine--glycine ligase [Neomegalonema sp.]|nr:phosphoribosylamine--glycine ligase [Neomegalonema sp.]